MKPFLIASLVLALASTLAAPTRAQTPDPRDYEVGYFVPSKTTIINTYLRHQTGTTKRDYSADALIFRATYIVKFGDLVVTPFDLILPVVDQRGFTPLSNTLAGVNPAFSAIPGDLKLTLHSSGIGDVIFLPTIGHGFVQDKVNHTHTWYAATLYVTAPTGRYQPERLLNVGSNRWTVQPLITAGQRFFRAVTLEANASMSFFADNDEYRLPVAAFAGQNLKLKQKSSLGGAVHLAVDLHPMFFVGTSYLVSKNGRRDFVADTQAGSLTRLETAGNTVHTFRLNFGIRVTPQTLFMAQWNEDVAGTESAALGRFFGLRISHAFFKPPSAPVTQAISDAAEPKPKAKPAAEPEEDEEASDEPADSSSDEDDE